MKRRLVILLLLLALIFLASVIVSGAPARVHVADLLTWYPPLVLAAAIIWSRRLGVAHKALGVGIVFAIAGWVALYASCLTVMKMEMTLLYYGAGILGWLLALPVFLALVHLVDRFLERCAVSQR